ncbi:hypothetical protein P8452_02535 [Trifolium repens]|nr:hypothetical protein P8452_02535 [Trifolium repens]
MASEKSSKKNKSTKPQKKIRYWALYPRNGSISDHAGTEDEQGRRRNLKKPVPNAVWKEFKILCGAISVAAELHCQPFQPLHLHSRTDLVPGEEYSSLESCSLTLFEIRRKLLRWSFRKALLGMELIHHSYSQSTE